MKVLYFAWVRAKVGVGEEDVTLPPDVLTVGDLIDWLAARSPQHAEAFADRALIRAARDQEHVGISEPITGAAEIAFFPPVTGG